MVYMILVSSSSTNPGKGLFPNMEMIYKEAKMAFFQLIFGKLARALDKNIDICTFGKFCIIWPSFKPKKLPL